MTLELDGIKFTITCTDSRELSRCYRQNTFKIHANQWFPDSYIGVLNKQGLLGGGQEFSADHRNLRKVDDGFELLVYDRVDSSD